jgi:hypothetical protein
LNGHGKQAHSHLNLPLEGGKAERSFLMKRFLLSALSVSVLALGLSAPALAEVVAYPGAALQDISNGWDTWNDSLTTSVTTDANGSHKSTTVSGGNATTPTNTVTLNATGAAADPYRVFGAVNFQDGDSVNYNTVYINGGTTGAVFGARHMLDSNDTTSVSGNRVIISGGEVTGNVSGGFAMGEGNASAIGNTVEITGGTLGNEVRGGFVISEGDAEASNNTVSISGTPDLTGAWLVGGDARAWGGAEISTGNTLQLASAGLSVAGLELFQRFEFTLPATLAPGGTMLTTTTFAYIGTDSVVTVGAPGLTVSPGNVFTLIDCAAAGCWFEGTVAAASQMGVLLGHNYTLSVEGGGGAGRLLLTIGAQVAVAPAITSANNATFTAGTGGTFNVAATGTAPITYSLAGAPAGVSIDGSTGVITVAPTVAANTYNFTVTASNGTPPDATQTFTLTIATPFANTATSVPVGGLAVLAALGLLLAGLAAVSIRRRGRRA